MQLWQQQVAAAGRGSGTRMLVALARQALHVLRSQAVPCLALLQVALEDSLVTMATILASRFVAGIRADVEKVDKQLATFAETLDQWMQVRRQAGAGRLKPTHHYEATAHSWPGAARLQKPGSQQPTCCRSQHAAR